MKVRIQRPISWVSYSVNEQEFSTEGKSRQDVETEIQQAKEISDFIERTYWQPNSVADFALIDENKILASTVETVSVASEQKTVLIEALKKSLWDVEYSRIRDNVLKSDAYNKINLHSDGAEA